MVFKKNILKWVIVLIESVKILKIADGTRINIVPEIFEDKLRFISKNEAFSQKMVFRKNVFKWDILPIESVKMSKIADNTRIDVPKIFEN